MYSPWNDPDVFIILFSGFSVSINTKGLSETVFKLVCRMFFINFIVSFVIP